MKITRTGGIAALALVGALALTSCAANETPSGDDSEAPESTLSGTFNGAGSSAQGAAQEAWIAAFQIANPKVTINYDPTGSGAGRETFIAGGSDWAGSDSALNDDELAGTFAACAADTKAIDLPTYISPIAVVFNVEGVDELNLDPTTLARIFKGEITNWNDPAIAAINEGTTFPDLAITAVHRSDDSGTTKNFSDYLNQVVPEIWDQKPADAFPFQSGEGAAKTSGVIDAVKNGVGTIGYADASAAGDLGTAKLKVGDEFVAFTPEAAAAVVAESPLVEGREGNDLAFKLNRTTTDPSHYPLVLVSYSIVCQEYADPAKGEFVKAYIGYITSEEGQQVAADAAGSAPLSSDLSAKVAAVVATIK
ncbi:phosphate ABC transporter substrate-binding protein PstS [Protaetiibacter intestinalis]|uniref:Phosphate-binding protein n=1 Tax=Protaetiibacter intestinalis TaxID=2419774 RepID=A0A387B8B2_9MICO|nr:phosphate ABC transporter substrate-binding protein PstS [Protaetiibacter intestinalis]AYF97435.1 phosphate ABC transporter substrate-binding protein PstS [Protaetiibacter intestinalis]